MIVSETKSESINILLAIQEVFLCNGVKAIFSPFDDLHIVGEIDNLENLVDSVKDRLPEIVILSVSERNLFVFDLVKTVKASNPEVSVIIMLETFKDELIYTALGLGVSACVTTGVQANELITCIRKVSQGEYPITDTLLIPEIAQLIIKEMDSYLSNNSVIAVDGGKTLSNEEAKILQLVAIGYTYDQLISGDKSSENDVMLHLTNIYGKLVYNSFLQFSTQPSEKTNANGQSINENEAEDDTPTQTINDSTPKQIIETEDNITVNDIHSEYTSPVWDGFEALKKELQETLEKLASVEDYHSTLEEDEQGEPYDTIEEDISKTGDTDELLSDDITEPHNHKIDDFEIAIDSSISVPFADEVNEQSSGIDEEDTRTIENNDEPLQFPATEFHNYRYDDFEMIDQEHGLHSENSLQEALPVKEDIIEISETEANMRSVNTPEEPVVLPQDTREVNEESVVKDNDEPVQQKSRWFHFSAKRDNQINVTDHKSLKNNARPDNTLMSTQRELNVVKEPDVTKDKKKTPKRENGDSKNTKQIEGKYNREEILSSVKRLGVPVLIQTPVDRKQLEKLESIIKHTAGINIILHKGTAQEHILVVSGQDSPTLLKTLRDIPFVQNPSDDNGTINMKLLPMTKTDY